MAAKIAATVTENSDVTSPMTKTTVKKQLEHIRRGVDEILLEKDLIEKLEESLKTGQPLTIKAGFDPTAPDLHLGHTVLIQKLAQFQQFGHQVVFLIGDFTGMVGDPSGKSKTRPQLTRSQVDANAETYKKQVFKILDPQKTRIQFNSEWLETLTAHDFIKLTSHANVARMLERDDFKKRYQEGQSISLHEFIYPLLQAYDSVVMKADVELGGRDQRFNLLLGRELMKDRGLPPQVCITMPLLEGLDGVQKMSKSLDNFVGVTDPPNDMFGKLMSMPDTLLRRYYELLSDTPLDVIDRIFSELSEGKLHPKDVKARFAMEMVGRYHGANLAVVAKEQFESVFSRKEVPENLPEYRFQWLGKDIWIPKLLVELKFAATTSEGKRLVAQKGIRIDSEVLEAEYFIPEEKKVFVIQCGKRRFARILL